MTTIAKPFRNNENYAKYLALYFESGLTVLLTTLKWCYKGQLPIEEHLADLGTTNSLRKTNKITSEEHNTLKELKEGKTYLRNLDIALIYKIIQLTCNLLPRNNKVWGRKCPISQQGELEHLLFQLKDGRNNLAHPHDDQKNITDKMVEDKFKEIKNLLMKILQAAAFKANIGLNSSEFNQVNKHIDDDVQRILKGENVFDLMSQHKLDQILNDLKAQIFGNDKLNSLFIKDIEKYTVPSLRNKDDIQTLKDIFQLNNSSVIVVQGEAGMGKTAMSRFLLHSWWFGNTDVVERLSLFDVVISVDCNQIFSSDINLLYERLFPEATRAFSNTISLKKSLDDLSVFWIMDGFDQYSARLKGFLRSMTNSLSEKHKLLITTRPNKYENLKGILCKCTLSMTSLSLDLFQDNNVEDIIQTLIINEENKENFKTHFHSLDETAKHLLRTPLNLNLYIKLWNQDPELVTNTFTTKMLFLKTIYKNLVLLKKRLYLSSIWSSKEDLNDFVNDWFYGSLCKQSFLMLMQQHYNTFRPNDLDTLKKAARDSKLDPSSCLSSFLVLVKEYDRKKDVENRREGVGIVQSKGESEYNEENGGKSVSDVVREGESKNNEENGGKSVSDVVCEDEIENDEENGGKSVSDVVRERESENIEENGGKSVSDVVREGESENIEENGGKSVSDVVREGESENDEEDDNEIRYKYAHVTQQFILASLFLKHSTKYDLKNVINSISTKVQEISTKTYYDESCQLLKFYVKMFTEDKSLDTDLADIYSPIQTMINLPTASIGYKSNVLFTTSVASNFNAKYMDCVSEAFKDIPFLEIDCFIHCNKISELTKFLKYVHPQKIIMSDLLSTTWNNGFEPFRDVLIKFKLEIELKINDHTFYSTFRATKNKNLVRDFISMSVEGELWINFATSDSFPACSLTLQKKNVEKNILRLFKIKKDNFEEALEIIIKIKGEKTLKFKALYHDYDHISETEKRQLLEISHEVFNDTSCQLEEFCLQQIVNLNITTFQGGMSVLDIFKTHHGNLKTIFLVIDTEDDFFRMLKFLHENNTTLRDVSILLTGNSFYNFQNWKIRGFFEYIRTSENVFCKFQKRIRSFFDKQITSEKDCTFPKELMHCTTLYMVEMNEDNFYDNFTLLNNVKGDEISKFKAVHFNNHSRLSTDQLEMLDQITCNSTCLGDIDDDNFRYFTNV